MIPRVGRAAFGLGTRRVRVRHYTGARVRGEWVETMESDEFVRMAVHPVNLSERNLLPEGMRTTDSVKVFTQQPLAVESNIANGGRGADRLFLDGFWWTVAHEQSWAPNGYRRYIATRAEKGSE